MSILGPILDNSFDLQQAEEYNQKYLKISRDKKISKSRRSRLKKHYKKEYLFWLEISQLNFFNL
jgi:hypothetical protein